MTDQFDGSTQPISSTPPAAEGPMWLSADAPSSTPPPPEPGPAGPGQPGPLPRGRTFRTRSVAAVAVVALLVGGGLGAAVGVAASGDDHRNGPEQAGFGGPQQGQSFGQAPDGQLPPGPAPDDDDDDD